MKFIIGLGNPGLRYRNTRHNIGFLTVESLAKRLKIGLRKKIFNGRLGKGRFGSYTLHLFMPMTYMNLSGEAVSHLVRKKDLPNTLVIYDDIDLKFGQVRIRPKGRDAGHRGLRSIIEGLKTDEFPRLRIGIRGEGEIKDTAAYVLSPFTAKERSLLKEVIDRATNCVLAWLEEGMDGAMNRFNTRET